MIPIRTIFWLSAASFVLSLLLTPLVRNAFLRRQIVDRPDGRRKLHALAVPRVGGIPLALSYLASYLALFLLPGANPLAMAEGNPGILSMAPAAAVIFLTGLLDDLGGLRPWQKLGGQVLGAVLAVWGGVHIHTLARQPLGEAAGAVITVVWLVGCTNAFNLIDGLDGLASGLALFSTLTTFVAAALTGDHMLALATLPLCGSLLGFLRYNFNPASVFLGDSGSLLIGFLLGCYGAIWSQKSATILGMTAPVMAMAIPLLDTSLAIARRWLRGEPIFSGDRNHIHHRLLERGLSQRGVVVVLYLMCALYASLSLLQSLASNQVGGLIVVLFCAVTWMGVQSLGYFEFGLAGRVLLGGALQRLLRGQILLHGLEGGLRRAACVEECFLRIEEASRQFGFTQLAARLNGYDFETGGDSRGAPRWQVRVPLPGGDYVNLWRRFDLPLQPAVIGSMVDLLHRSLPPNLARLAVNPEAFAPTEVASLVNLAAGIEAAEGEQAGRNAPAAGVGR